MIFGFFQNDSKFRPRNMRYFTKNRKSRFSALKNCQKTQKKFFFSGMSRNRLKLSKNMKNRNSDRYSSIKSDFSIRFLALKMCNLDHFWPKNCQKCHILGVATQLLEHGLGVIRVEKIQNHRKSVFGSLNRYMIRYKANQVVYSRVRAVILPEFV